MTPERVIELAHQGKDRLLQELLSERLGVEPGDPDAWPLVQTALDCLCQVTMGKGKERHQRGRAFVDQPIMVIPRLLGGMTGMGGLLYQAMKKAEEASGFSDRTRMISELRGAVIYMLAAVMFAVETSPPR